MTDPIEIAWQAGLDCLKPSRRDLEHGLAIHKDALVFELYGFIPQMAPDVEAINAVVAAGDPPDELRELLRESRLLAFLKNPEARARCQQAWERSGVDCLFYGVAEMDRPPLVLMRQLARLLHATDELRDVVQPITRPDDVSAARRRGLRGIVSGSNQVPLAGEGATVARELRFISTLFHMGCRTMHLTYNRRNLLGDGCMERGDGGLSDFGKAAVAELNRQGMIIDVAHSGHRTSYEAAKASSQPIVASHTAASNLHDHPRNKPDAVLKAIADSGGLIGVVALPDFIGLSGDLSAVLDHIDYIANLVGTDHVAIGMDRAYEDPLLASAKASIQAQSPPPFPDLWPPGTLGDPQWRKPHMLLSTEWTNWPLITVGLVQRGYGDEAIRKIIGENTLRVWRAIHEARRT